MALNLLIVDDSTTARSIVKKVLGLSGVALGVVQEAADGAEALQKLNAAWFDLVIADLNMPGMDGRALVAAMSAHPLFKDIPVLILSSEGDEQQIETLYHQGIKAFMRKPFSPAELKSFFEKELGQVERQKAAGAVSGS